jgi:hypothetical protein
MATLRATEAGLREAMMSQFHNDFDVRRCNESRDHQILITITGLTLDGHIKAFTGIVQSVEHDLEHDQGRRWRVTILD